MPLYEAKLFHQYDHRFATFDEMDEKALRGGNAREMTPLEKMDPEAVVIPRYWVPEEEVAKKLDKREEIGSGILKTRRDKTDPLRPRGIGPQLALRKIARATDERTGIFAMIAGVGLSDFWHDHRGWFIAFRDISSPANQRTSIFMAIPGVAVSNKAPLVQIEYARWLQTFCSIARATDERTVVSDNVPPSGVGNSAPVMTYEHSQAIASVLVLANLNSLPLDWAARLSVGGVNMNFYIVKQLPVLPPETYMEEACPGIRYAEVVVPRALELTYTAHDLRGFAQGLGYDGPPFLWDEDRRHRLKCELDGIFAHMYQLDRTDLEWILDAPSPSASFPTLKRNEMRKFGEYRTQRYVLQAYDQLAGGNPPNL